MKFWQFYVQQDWKTPPFLWVVPWENKNYNSGLAWLLLYSKNRTVYRKKKADLNFVRNDVYRFPSVSAQNRDMLKHFTCLNFKNDISDMSVIDKSRLWWWALFLYGWSTVSKIDIVHREDWSDNKKEKWINKKIRKETHSSIGNGRQRLPNDWSLETFI